MSDAPALYALLVGINNYANPQVPDLRGCVRDVDEVEKVLRGKFDVPATNIKKLTDKQATHDAIKAAFRSQLIGAAQTWKANGSPEPKPAFYFHYSGHGSQARDETGTEPDGMDETIVAHDSRQPGIYDIKDWELGQLIDELGQFTDNITIVLDCCHSGSGTRDFKENVSQTRRCKPDERPQPEQRPTGLRSKRSIGPSASNWEVGEAQYVLIAGCRDREESNEHPVMDGAQRAWHGALTYFYLQELAQLHVGSPPTYDEVYQRISRTVNTTYPDQMPQCEGERSRLLFGGRGPQRDLFFRVFKRRDSNNEVVDDGLVWIDGGLVHGLTELSQLKVFSADTRSSADAHQAIATLEIEECRAAQSGCRVIDGATELADGSVVALHRLNLGNLQRTVLLDIADPTLRAAVDARIAKRAEGAAADISDYVRVVPETAAADFRIAEVAGELQIQDNTERLLTAPYRSDQLEELAGDLVRIVRYHNALDLHNSDTQSELAGAISVEMKHLTGFDPVTNEPLTEPLPRSAGGEVIAEVGTSIVWEIVNHSEHPLFFALLGFAADWEIYQLYPPREGAREQLTPHLPFYFYGSRRNPAKAQLPKDFVGEAKDFFKVIATVKDADYSVLVQKPLASPFTKRALRSVRGSAPSALDQLLTQAMNGQTTRAYGSDESTPIGDEWTTADMKVLTVDPASKAQRSLAPASSVEFPAYQIRFDAPAGFTGQVSVLTATQSTRAADGDLTDLQPPPGLATAGDWLQPLAVGSKRSVATAGAIIELAADNAAYAAITPETPLTMQLGWEADPDSAGVVALAYDGSFFYPVGHSTEADQQTVAVNWLPQPDAEDVQPERSKRGVGRVLKLYLYKMLKRQEPSLGLHRVRRLTVDDAFANPPQVGEHDRSVPDGILRYAVVDETAFKAGERVLLLVHGFSSITTHIADWALTRLTEQGLTYDHVLAYDYETFNTAISSNGQALANLLRQLKFDENDGRTLDVVAHSMGTLVTRSMVEQWHGNRFVDRCFLAGSPNQGTRLADAKKLVPWLSTLFLNGGSAGLPPAALAGWGLNKLTDDAIGIEDLRPNAQWLSDLNGSNQPAEVDYFLLIGTNSKPETADANAWQRLKQKVMQGADLALDVIFGAENDMVISVPSMLGVRNGNYPAAKLQTALVRCTHGEYFSYEPAYTKLAEWLRLPLGGDA